MERGVKEGGMARGKGGEGRGNDSGGGKEGRSRGWVYIQGEGGKEVDRERDGKGRKWGGGGGREGKKVIGRDWGWKGKEGREWVGERKGVEGRGRVTEGEVKSYHMGREGKGRKVKVKGRE